MEYHHFMDILQDKDDDAAYAATKRIAAESEFSDEYYKFIPEFVELLDHKKSYIRTRAMILCCSQARWDNEGVIAKYLPQMLRLVHDEKPTVVRQSLNALKEIVVFRPELCDVIAAELERMDISGYKDSMISLIRKDINELKEKLSATKVAFGSEPKDDDAYEFILEHCYSLQFSPAVAAVVRKQKRIQRILYAQEQIGNC